MRNLNVSITVTDGANNVIASFEEPYNQEADLGEFLVQAGEMVRQVHDEVARRIETSEATKVGDDPTEIEEFQDIPLPF